MTSDASITPLLKPSCRYCQETEPEADLIRPCLCNGTLAFAHNHCLAKWRHLKSENVPVGVSIPEEISTHHPLMRPVITIVYQRSHCEICQGQYNLPAEPWTVQENTTKRYSLDSGVSVVELEQQQQSRRRCICCHMCGPGTARDETLCWLLFVAISLAALIYSVAAYFVEHNNFMTENKPAAIILWGLLAIGWTIALTRKIRRLLREQFSNHRPRNLRVSRANRDDDDSDSIWI